MASVQRSVVLEKHRSTDVTAECESNAPGLPGTDLNAAGAINTRRTEREGERWLMKLTSPISVTVGIAATLAIGLAVSTVVSGGGNVDTLGARVRAILAQPNDGKTLATVNGKAITQRRLDFDVANSQANGDFASRDVLLSRLIERVALLAEADKRGIAVTDVQLDEFLREQKDLAERDPNRTIHQYAAALGVPYDQLWGNSLVRTTWREQLTIGALKRTVTAAIPAEPRTGDVAAKEAAWQSFVQSIRQAADVRVNP